MINLDNDNEVIILKEMIKNGSALYYYRATPFTEHGEFNYNGALKDKFFFPHMFSKKGKCDEYVAEIKDSLKNHNHKSILLIGNQGCGKTTFVHNLERECDDCDFIFFDFDADTSNPTLEEYIEKMSLYLLNLLKSDDDVNKEFYNTFILNKILINKKINASNNSNNFFEVFNETFIKNRNENEKDDFIKIINGLYFNQILSLIILWHLSRYKINRENNKEFKKIVFCLDNLDVLVNKEIIEKFFREYFRFVRNVDSIIQHLREGFWRQQNITYNGLFAFVFSCRQHTWARVKEHYRQDNNFVQISTLERNISDAFEKNAILQKRKEYIENNRSYYGEFMSSIEKAQSVLADMDATEMYRHNIYDLFDDDYRQCTITFEQVLKSNPNLFNDYSELKAKINRTSDSLYGARGMIYKALFDKFKQKGIFDAIGVLDVSANKPLVSNARMILNYLNYYTYSADKNNQRYITFEKIVDAFDGIIDKEDIDSALRAMFKLGYDSPWNELIAFNEIHSEEISDCKGLEIFITKAGHEYLSLIATHFEFFNTRVSKRRTLNVPLFSKKSMTKYKNSKYKYAFQETISLVLEIVSKCCEKMSNYYTNVMKKRFNGIEEYLQSPYVYGDANVLHGERIIHTHIRYIDTFRLFILHEIEDADTKEDVNKILVEFIEEYIKTGEKYPALLTSMSTVKLFPDFKDKIKIIRDSDFKDFETRIDVKKQNIE